MRKKCCIFSLYMLKYMLLYEHDIVIQKEVNSMKEGIHPDYQQTTIRCACGEVIETGSTKKDIKVEICSKCHPFYTGKQKLVDTSGRVDKFNKKFGLKQRKCKKSGQEAIRLPARFFN